MATAATAARIATCAAALLGASINLACHKDREMFNRSKNEAGVSRDVDAIMRLLNLPSRPLEVWWEETPVGVPGGLGPTDYDLRVVLHFDAATVADLTKDAPPLPGAPVLFPPEADRPWLPPPVRAAIQRHDDHTLTIRGTKFDAQPLLRPPYASGAFIVIDGGEYVFISVRTS